MGWAALFAVHRERRVTGPVTSHFDQCAVVSAVDGAVQVGLHDG